MVTYTRESFDPFAGGRRPTTTNLDVFVTEVARAHAYVRRRFVQSSR